VVPPLGTEAAPSSGPRGGLRRDSRDAGDVDVELAQRAHLHPRDTNVAKNMATAQRAVNPVVVTHTACGD